MRLTGIFGLSTSIKCQLMDSPSRSSSVARISSSHSANSSLSVFTIRVLVFGTQYIGAKFSFTLTPRLAHFSFLYFSGTSFADCGRSRTCPMQDSTVYSLPKNLRMVLALVGDSTITNFLPELILDI